MVELDREAKALLEELALRLELRLRRRQVVGRDGAAAVREVEARGDAAAREEERRAPVEPLEPAPLAPVEVAAGDPRRERERPEPRELGRRERGPERRADEVEVLRRRELGQLEGRLEAELGVGLEVRREGRGVADDRAGRDGRAVAEEEVDDGLGVGHEREVEGRARDDVAGAGRVVERHEADPALVDGALRLDVRAPVAGPAAPRLLLLDERDERVAAAGPHGTDQRLDLGRVLDEARDLGLELALGERGDVRHVDVVEQDARRVEEAADGRDAERPRAGPRAAGHRLRVRVGAES